MQSDLGEEVKSLLNEIKDVKSIIESDERNSVAIEEATVAWYDVVREQLNNVKAEVRSLKGLYTSKCKRMRQNGRARHGQGVTTNRQQQEQLEMEESSELVSTHEPGYGERIDEEAGSSSVNGDEEAMCVVGQATCGGGKEDNHRLSVEVVGDVEEVEGDRDASDVMREAANVERGDDYELYLEPETDGELEQSFVYSVMAPEDDDCQLSLEPVENQELEQSIDHGVKTPERRDAVNNEGASSNVLVMPDTKQQVSLHRRFEAPAQLAQDTASSQLNLEQNVLVRSFRDDQWYPGVVLDISYRNYCAYRYMVLSEGKRIRVKGNDLALMESCTIDSIDVGTRVIAVYGGLDVLYAGIIAEVPCAQNCHRILLFFDDGFAQYITLDRVHLVCKSGGNIWDEVARHSREFIQHYLYSYPIRAMVRLTLDQELCVEWRGSWMKAFVTQLDCSLVKVLFVETRLCEWLYRGSTRLEPLLLAISKKSDGDPPAKGVKEVECSGGTKFIITYDHFDSFYDDDNNSYLPTSSSTDNTGLMPSLDAAGRRNVCGMGGGHGVTSTPENNNHVVATPGGGTTATDCDRQGTTTHRHVDAYNEETVKHSPAKRIRLAPSTLTDLSPLMKISIEQGRQLRRSSVGPSSFASRVSKRCLGSKVPRIPDMHAVCDESCCTVHEPVQLDGVYNPLAIPLFNGWKRHAMAVNTKTSRIMYNRHHIYYTSPCGRKLRSIVELDHYLTLTKITHLTIDQFSFNSLVVITTDPATRPDNAKYYLQDISGGKENCPVSCVNELDDEGPPSFCYTTERVCSKDVVINTEPSYLVGCDCTDGCRVCTL